ncbi:MULTISPECIES: aldehyde dehydrogenase family protein [unclassified Xanthobacter]|uniref:aldehyde dehydrogenase family protein n=1 Tax=unclassified Xanthobacter TaxID=2623496 RepID=UPI001EE06D5C|nr:MULTISPECIES: aldehyde dehydrogenase family protein [unclassified Xanthobacter]
MRDFDPSQIAFANGHFIGGEVVEGRGGDTVTVRRPSDAVAYAELPIGGADLVDRAVVNAQAAARTSGWATCPPRERARILRRWADLMEARSETLAPLEAFGSTRPIAQAGGDVVFSAECIRFCAEYADKLGGDVAATKADNLGLIISEPYGVVGAITPWNFPLIMASWKLGPALAAGNAIVLKPSELTPFSTVRLAELAIEAGMPAGIFNVVQGTGAVTGEALSRHPGIGKLSFTGSTRTGAAVMTAAAQSGMKPVTLELGGKSPQLVFADAPDLDQVAGHICQSILGNAGQACVAGSRVIVQRAVGEALLEKLKAHFAAVEPGLTWLAASTFSPIISPAQADRIDGILARSRAAGAEALVGGARFAEFTGAFYQPTIMTQANEQTPVVREEVFGPVITFQLFDEEEEGFALADHPDYGLAAGVYTGDFARGLRAMRTLQAGTVWINRYNRTGDFILPTGGYKSSGIGKDLGRQAVEANMRHKTVLIDFAS